MVLTVLDRLLRGFASSAREELDAITYKLLASETKYKRNGKSTMLFCHLNGSLFDLFAVAITFSHIFRHFTSHR